MFLTKMAKAFILFDVFMFTVERQRKLNALFAAHVALLFELRLRSFVEKINDELSVIS